VPVAGSASATAAISAAYHVLGDGSDWATGNRIMCDFVHRGIVPLTPREVTYTSIDVLGMELVLAA